MLKLGKKNDEVLESVEAYGHLVDCTGVEVCECVAGNAKQKHDTNDDVWWAVAW